MVKCVKPLFHLLQLFALSPFSFKTEKCRPETDWRFVCYSLAGITVRIAILVCVFCSGHFLTRENQTQITSIIDTVLICFVRLLEIVIMVESLIKRSKQIQYLHYCGFVDEAITEKLLIDMHYHRLRQGTIRSAAIWFVAFFAAQGIIIWMSMVETIHYVLFCSLYAQSFFASSLNYFQMIFYVKLLRFRIHVVNRTLEDLSNDHRMCVMPRKYNFKVTRVAHRVDLIDDSQVKTVNATKSADENYILEKLVTLRTLYQQLWEQSIRINRQFQWSLPLNIGNDFFSLLSNCYWVFLFLLKSEKSTEITMSTIRCLTWAILNIVHIFMLSKQCHKTSVAAAQVPISLHKIRNFTTSSNMKFNAFIEHFSLQLLHQKIHFSAFGFFTIDYTLIFMVIFFSTFKLLQSRAQLIFEAYISGDGNDNNLSDHFNTIFVGTVNAFASANGGICHDFMRISS